MKNLSESIFDFSSDVKSVFKKRQSILSFGAFLDLVRANPKAYMRTSAEYLRDCFDYFGTVKPAFEEQPKRFRLFDLGTDRGVSIVGGENVQSEIYQSLQAFVRQGVSNKVIFLHGPNGSAKSSTIEAISNGMQKYSESDEGAMYRFNWIFPIERGSTPRSISGESGPIGFSRGNDSDEKVESYAFLSDSQIASKLQSEFKENPLYLIPMPYREKVLKEWVVQAQGSSKGEVNLPSHVLLSGLSKRNQMIFENLLTAYDGDVQKVYRHIQVERFIFSRQYRVGISTVEPQMSVDAQEKQLTMDKNIANLPAVLHNIRFTESFGELVEANRGILELSDLLKRPVDAFKYLLTTVERGTLGFPSATQHLDIVFFATANEKHLDAFKTSPDFSSFKGRFDLVTVPYLLKNSEEQKIYSRDVVAISQAKPVAAHSLEVLCLWAIMTRLKQPDPELYESGSRGLINRLDPFGKAMLYDDRPLGDNYSPADQVAFKGLRKKIVTESSGTVIYEGRFGASPREVRALLYRMAEDSSYKTITPMSVFAELEKLVKDRSVYDFLQFEPRNKYHDAAFFIGNIKDFFAEKFEEEILSSMNLVEGGQYEKLLHKYIDNAVAFVKNEKIFNRKTEANEQPSDLLMKDVEDVIGVSGDPSRFRESLLSRIAGFKIENPKMEINLNVIFSDHLQKIREHYYEQHSKSIAINLNAILAVSSEQQSNFKQPQLDVAKATLESLESKFGYTKESAVECVRFLISHKNKRAM